LKANFKISTANQDVKNTVKDSAEIKSDASKKEFEEFVSKAGAAGSFMIFRSEKKDHELGIEEL